MGNRQEANPMQNLLKTNILITINKYRMYKNLNAIDHIKNWAFTVYNQQQQPITVKHQLIYTAESSMKTKKHQQATYFLQEQIQNITLLQ